MKENKIEGIARSMNTTRGSFETKENKLEDPALLYTVHVGEDH